MSTEQSKYTYPCLAKLQYVHEVSDKDWLMGMTKKELASLRDADDNRELVIIMSQETDTSYNIKLSDGTIVRAICDYHLDVVSHV